VLSLAEAPDHPHLAARGTFVDFDSHRQPAPAPRFFRTPAAITRSPAAETVNVEEVAARWSRPD
jgi:alpha-methylacyl-CoA racemase